MERRMFGQLIIEFSDIDCLFGKGLEGLWFMVVSGFDEDPNNE